MNAQTETQTRNWYVSTSPAVGDRVVSQWVANSEEADEEIRLRTNGLVVTRVNYSTGRGTVRPAKGGKATQIVRGRFGWCLANGHATDVQFATEQQQPATQVETAPAALPEPADEQPTPASMRRTYRLQTVADVPFGHYPDWDNGGPALVVVDGWGTSLSHGDGIDGYRVNAYRVPWTGERHELDGTCYPTRELADKAKYDAGLIAYMVYTDRTYPATA